MKASIPNLGYINCYSLSNPRPVKSPSNCARHNCQKICSWLWKPKTILEIRKKGTILWVINNPIIYKFSKTLLTTERRPTGWWFLTVDLSRIWKQDAFRQILKIRLKLFKTTTGIDIFNESRFDMTFIPATSCCSNISQLAFTCSMTSFPADMY